MTREEMLEEEPELEHLSYDELDEIDFESEEPKVYKEKYLSFTVTKKELKIFIENQRGNGGEGSSNWVNLNFLLDLQALMSDIHAEAIVIDEVRISIYLINQLIDDLREKTDE